MEPNFIDDCMIWDIPYTSWKLQGFSVAGKRTGFKIKSLNLLLDGGMNCRKIPKNILVTHSHSDHTFFLPCIAMNRYEDTKNKPVVYCPNEMVKPLQLLARASQSLNDCCSLIPQNPMLCKGVAPGDIFFLAIKKRRIKITVCKCNHIVPTVGYIISEERNKLKDQYKDLSGKEIHQLKQKKISICNLVDCLQMVFLGDTTIDVFKLNPQILQSPVIVIECTVFGNQIRQETVYARGHIHWNQLKPFVQKYETIEFVLIHFSPRYKPDEIITFFKKEACRNVTLWIGKQYFKVS